MGLTASLAVLRVHVLVVELPGRPVLRLRAEAAVRGRGWLVVRAVEDADLLLVCGGPGPEVASAVDVLWSQVPAPRARRTVRTPEELPDALDSAARVLADTRLQRSAAAEPRVAPPVPDGRFGPLRPGWPSGLVVDCAVDPTGRVSAVGTRRIAGEQEDEPVAVRAFVLPVATAAAILRALGREALALRLDRAVDLAIGGVPPQRLHRRLRSVERAVRRSATLRWAVAPDPAAVRALDRLPVLLAAAIDAAGVAPAGRLLLGQRLESVPLLVAATEGISGG
jgi:hypothetical protein